jgi:hypothetical protein
VADKPSGIGISLLEKIFGSEKIVSSHKKALWGDLVDNLASKQYDIIATPIFETNERSKHIAFCSPLFYSDIGIYVKKVAAPSQKYSTKRGSSIALGSLPENSLSFEDAISLLTHMKLKIIAIDGEISGKMALKYLGLKREDIEWLKPETSSVHFLIASVGGGNDMECDIVFAEVFQAEQTDSVKNGNVINILKSKEVLYPVSFAVRKQDYVLKNYINLKLLEIEENEQNGILGIILDELKMHLEYKHYNLNDIKKYFVRELDRGSHQVEPLPSDNEKGLGDVTDEPISQKQIEH